MLSCWSVVGHEPVSFCLDTIVKYRSRRRCRRLSVVGAVRARGQYYSAIAIVVPILIAVVIRSLIIATRIMIAVVVVGLAVENRLEQGQNVA